MSQYFIDNQSQSEEYKVNDMFINDKLELIRIKDITKLAVFPDQAMICTAKKQQYQISQRSNNLLIKTNKGIDVSEFVDLSKLTVYSSKQLFFLTSMFNIAEIRDSYYSSIKHLNNVNILYLKYASLNPIVKYEDALFNNNYEKIFDKTFCNNAYSKFKKLHDIIDKKLVVQKHSINTSLTSMPAGQITTNTIISNTISIPRF